MPTVTLTLSDTPNGAVAIHSTYDPASDEPPSPAQRHAAELLRRTQAQWCIHIDAPPGGLVIPARNSARGQHALRDQEIDWRD